MKHLTLSSLVLGALALTSASGAQAQPVCSAVWTLPWGIGTKSAPIQGSSPPCPAVSVLATVGVGSGTNAGQVAPSGVPWNSFSLSNLYPTTSDSSVVVGSPASAANDLTLTFDQPVLNPYFYTSFFNAGESLTFSSPFTILQSNGINLSGMTISGSGDGSIADAGFVARFLGSYSQIGFNYANANPAAASFAFTTGVTPVPGPLPILGVGAALGQARRLRRLSTRLRERQITLD